jgi:hypothetical protein
MLPIDSEPTRSKVVTTTPDGFLVTKNHQPTADAKRLTSFLNQKEFPKTSFLPATGEVGLTPDVRLVFRQALISGWLGSNEVSPQACLVGARVARPHPPNPESKD